ncbi:proline-rich receptor-like protein kinase PERK12 [Syzygium oleosum]|uniref:proline-rich receptor-like protein kinase PERK12 n=1 Tax=Syzygium oleosum TaxID=219896 RepID=UPI0024BA43F6|nr:proline-rich receptor-like protein kinase PERK12 [Syzygium oleosum]
MGKLQPTASNTNLEPSPLWDADPTSPPPASATTDPPPPDSLTTDPPQTRNTNSDDHEKTSTSPLPSPKPTIPPLSLTSQVDLEPSAPPLCHPDNIESMQAVVFPPAPPLVAATVSDNQIVPYVPLQNNSNKQETGRNFGPNNAATGPYGAPGAHVNSHTAAARPAVMFPPQKVDHQVPLPSANNGSVPVHDNNFAPAAAASVGPVGGSSRLQPEGPQVILVPFVGVPWRSGLFDCYQHPTNAIITTVAPCVTFGQIAEILDNGSTSCLTGALLYFFLFLVICHWNIGVRYRRRLRNAFQIAETPVTDQLAHVLCPLCSLCQEFRELKYRGLDPFQGYQGVIAGILHEQRQQGAAIIPPTSQAMMR